MFSKRPVFLDFINEHTGVVPDSNLGMDKCDLQDDSYDSNWKNDNNNLFATLTPAWLTAIPTPVVTTVAASKCDYEKTSGGLTTISSGAGSIKSENYPSMYPANQECSWHLTNSDSEKYIEVDVQRVDQDCRDRLVVNPKSSRSYRST